MRCLLVLAILIVARPTLAQTAGAEAEALFKEARALLAAGKTAEACGAFAASQKLEPAVTTLLNLASCREKNGELATAWALFLDAERQTRGATDPARTQLHATASERAAKLEPRISKLTINVPEESQVDGLEITRGGERIEAERWNRSLPIDGGTYTITARAPGSSTWSTEVQIGAERDSKAIDIPDVRALPAAAAPSPPTPPAPRTDAPIAPARSRALPMVIGAGGAVLLAGALGMHLWGNATYDDARAEMRDQTRRGELEASANTKRYVAQGLAAGGAIAAGVAVWWLVRGGPGDADRTATRVITSPSGIAITGVF